MEKWQADKELAPQNCEDEEKPELRSQFATETFSFDIPTTSGVSAIASSKQEDSDDADGSDEEEYLPPKEHVTPVEDKDAVYTKRCKLFQKKDDKYYVERGLSMLYIKPQNGKYQLLVRAYTRLGSILLNIWLAPTLPVFRLGKNNVALMCILNPPPVDSEVDPATPTTMLLRVRTADDADELWSALDYYKGQAAI